MSLTVEDGSGITGADSYASVSEADQHFSAISDHIWHRSNEAAKEAALKWAAQYADMFTYPGARMKPQQGLKWPRLGAVDDEGRCLSGLPAALKSAVYELSGRYLAEGADGRVIAREKVGQIDITYERSGKTTSFAFRLLALIGAAARRQDIIRG